MAVLDSTDPYMSVKFYLYMVEEAFRPVDEKVWEALNGTVGRMGNSFDVLWSVVVEASGLDNGRTELIHKTRVEKKCW